LENLPESHLGYSDSAYDFWKSFDSISCVLSDFYHHITGDSHNHCSLAIEYTSTVALSVTHIHSGSTCCCIITCIGDFTDNVDISSLVSVKCKIYFVSWFKNAMIYEFLNAIEFFW